MTEQLQQAAPTLEAWGQTLHVNTGVYLAAPEQPFIELMDAECGSTFCIASVCLPEQDIRAFAHEGNQPVFIKNWGENEGVAEALVAAGIIKFTGKTVPAGFCQAEVAYLMIPVQRT